MATDRNSKALEGKAHTSDTLQAWQEPFDRQQTVPVSAVQASEIIAGMAGSWAAAFFSEAASSESGGSTSALNTPELRTWKLGQPGFPEINFTPYNWGTNRFGSKGPSLLGHPISMSVVGPTLKTAGNDWQWVVVDNSATPGTGDTIALDTVDSMRSTTGVPAAPNSATLANAYGFSDMTPFPNGLYMVVLLTGAEPSVGPDGTGCGDGYVFSGGGGAKNAISPLNGSPTAKYEIFRVTAVVNATTLRLDPVKRLATYFNIPATPYVRAVMLFEPAVTRLVGLPSGLGKGKEKTFVVVPPERASNGEFLPPHTGTIGWTTGGFDPLDATLVGLTALYGERPALAIPRPVEQRTGRLLKVSDALAAENAGRMVIYDTGALAVAGDIGKILHVHRMKAVSRTTLMGNPPPALDSVLGWFEILAVAGAGATNRYVVRRIAEVDPETGKFFFGSTRNVKVDDTTFPGTSLELTYTIHDNILTGLHKAAQLDLDKVESARLKNLIDPAWVKRSAKHTVLAGTSAARADKAIWDTSSSASGNANPGSLLDLGFRMVLYPAKLSGGSLAPDMDKPITSREVVLDPTQPSVAQSIDIDYSAGLVTLSHTPVPGTGCAVAPGGLIVDATNNPRGEIVLYAACVPSSMEEGQRGAGVRVVTSLDTQAARDSAEEPHKVDVWSSRQVFPVVHPQTVSSGKGKTLTLDIPFAQVGDIPNQGFLELRKSSEYGVPIFFTGAVPLALFGWCGKDDNGGKVRLTGVFGGKANGVPDTYATLSATDVVAVLRKDVRTPVSEDGTAGIGYAHDTSYGFAKRSSILHVRDGGMGPRADGGMSITPSGASELFRPWLLSGGQISSSVLTISVAQTVLLANGVRNIVGPRSILLVDGTTNYVYCRALGGQRYTVTVAPTLPLPTDNDILLAKVVTSGGAVTENLDLRNPLIGVDKRLDILVGETSGQVTPHFSTLAAAVAYCSEIMDPTGDNGTHLRIKVVGFTNEATASLPIKIKTNGLIIEGAAVRLDGAAGPPDSPTAIRWGVADAGTEKSLFDLNGKANLNFRDLVFQCTATATHDSPSRAVFLNTGGQVDNLRVLNCRATGTKLHGLTYITAGGLVNAHFRGCVVASSDFGIRIKHRAIGCIVEGCSFTGGTTQKTASAELDKGAIDCIVAGSAVSDNVFRDNQITGYRYGIATSGLQERVLTNTIVSTKGTGIYFDVSGSSTWGVIKDNHLTTVSTDAAGTRWGILAQGHDTKVEGNYVQIGGALVGGEIGIQVDGTRDHVAGNYVTNAMVVAADCRVHDNHVAGGDITMAGSLGGFFSNNRVSGNLTLLSGSASGQRVTALGNQVNGTLTVTGNSCRVADNFISGALTLTGNESTTSGNQCGSALFDGTDHVVSGNRFSSHLNIRNGSTDCVISGNSIEGNIVNTQTAATKPAGTVIVGNRVKGGFVLTVAIPVANDPNGPL